MPVWTPKRALSGVVAAALITGGTACGGPAADGSADADPPPVAPTAPAGDPSSRLTARLSGITEPAARRNLFRFGVATADRGDRGRSSTHDDLPELPLPLPRPAIRVLGVATDGGKDGGPLRRTAILSVGGDLVLAPEGTVVAGRYRVLTIGERDVLVVDEVDRHVERFALR